jgi:predicted RND superfamily exporter protein
LFPFLLTSITTFCGLAPMIFETSFQARIMIPMAITLGYGIIFATFVTLILIQALYLIMIDVGRILRRIFVMEDRLCAEGVTPVAENQPPLTGGRA